MSKSQIKRLHQQQELEKVTNEEQSEEPVTIQRKGPANRFTFFDDDDGDTGNNSEEMNNSDEEAEKVQQSTNKKKAKANKKKGKKAAKEPEETENQMLARLAALNLKEAKKAAADNSLPSMEELMKVDMKLFDMSAEIKRKLGKAFKEAVAPGQTDENRWPPGKRATGRIVKNKPRWFPDRDYGLSMIQTKEENGAIWFALRHNNSYEQRERMFWLAEKEMNVGVVQEIFADTPYHLNSLLMMAHVNRMNEDFNTGADLIERGIWHVDQYAAPTFEPFNWRHRMNYIEYENRAFFLLLHRHMLNAAQKRCWETAWNTAKLIFKLDPVGDPLGVMSIIDTYALKAHKYTWIIQVFEAAQKFKKLHLLPNWPYSVALARFNVAKNDEEREAAEKELCTAIRHFPSVVVQLMDLLQIHPDSAVMNCKMLTSFVADNEKDSLKLLVKIYAKETEEVWKGQETLLFLEGATRKVATSKDAKENEECEEWRTKRGKMYHGRSPNVDRLGQLLEVIPTSSLSDPVPPVNGLCQYSKEGGINGVNIAREDSFFGALFHSLLPHFQDQTFEEQINQHREEFMHFLAENVDNARNRFENVGEVVARWIARRNEPEQQGAGGAEVIRLEHETPFDLPEEPEEFERQPEQQ